MVAPPDGGKAAVAKMQKQACRNCPRSGRAEMMLKPFNLMPEQDRRNLADLGGGGKRRIHSGAQIAEEVFRLMKARKRSNTLCIASFRDKVRRKTHRQDVCSEVSGVYLRGTALPESPTKDSLFCGYRVFSLISQRENGVHVLGKIISH